MGGWYGWRLVCVLALLALGCRVGLAQIGPRYVLELPAPRQGGPAPERGSIALGPNGLATIRFHGLTVALAGPDGTLPPAGPAADPADLAVLLPGAGALPSNGMLPASGAPTGAVRTNPDPDGTAVALVYAEPPASEARQERTPPGVARHPMQAWDTLYLRKGQARLRVTAMQGRPGTVAIAGFMLEIGTLHATCRIYVSGAVLAAGELAALPQRLPGAELALVPAPDGRGLAVLRRAGGRDLFLPVAAPDGRYSFALLRR
jgi:hypothetical protein